MHNLNRALNIIERGLTTKAAQKLAIDFLNRHYESICRSFQNDLLGKVDSGEKTPEEIRPVYYGLPLYPFQYKKEKHDAVLIDYPDEVKKIHELLKLRDEVMSVNIESVKQQQRKMPL